MPEDHECTFDFIQYEAKKLQKELVKVENEKIEKIDWYWGQRIKEWLLHIRLNKNYHIFIVIQDCFETILINKVFVSN